MRRILRRIQITAVFCVSLLLLLAAALPAYAAAERVYDGAGLFTDNQAAVLEQEIAALRSHTGMDAVVVTTDQKQGMSTQDFAEQCYVTGGFGEGSEKSGFLYLIDMEDRVPHIATVGGAIQIFSDSNLDEVLDHVYDSLVDGNYAKSAETVLQDFTGYYDDAVSRGWTYDASSGIWSEPVRKRSLSLVKILIAAAVGGLAAGGATTSVKKKYAMKDAAAKALLTTAGALGAAGIAFALSNRRDDLVNTNTTRRAIPIANNRGSGGRGSGGPFGGSTTHTGAGGTTFGGKTGRKF